MKDRRAGDVFLLVGSMTEEVMRARSGILVQTEDIEELKIRFPGLLNSFQAGLRSMMSVPLFAKDRVIGSFHIRSLKQNAYSETDMKLAARVGNQIAGAVANAQLFIERKRAEEELQTSNRFLEIANRQTKITPLLKEFVAEVKKLTGCAAVGIRILDGKRGHPVRSL